MPVWHWLILFHTPDFRTTVRLFGSGTQQFNEKERAAASCRRNSQPHVNFEGFFLRNETA